MRQLAALPADTVFTVGNLPRHLEEITDAVDYQAAKSMASNLCKCRHRKTRLVASTKLGGIRRAGHHKGAV